VTVSWTAPENRNRKGWKILRAQRPEAGGDPLTPQPLAASSFLDKTGVVGATYYYRIVAVNQRGEEGLPRFSQAVVFRGGPPPPPSALNATLKTGRIILKWSGSPAASGYQIERSIAGKEWTILNNVVNGEPQFEDIYPSDAMGTFRYRVISWSTDDQRSVPSDVLEVRLPDTAPPLTPVINSISGEGGKVTLHFTAMGGSGDASGFFVLKSLTRKEPGEIVNATPLAATAEQLIDPDVEAGVTYLYRVYAVDRAGNRSVPSDPAGVLVGEPPLTAPPVPRARFEATPFPRVIFEFAASSNPSIRYALERQDPKGAWMLIQGPFPQATSSVMDAHPPHHAKVSYRLFTVAASGSAGPRSPVVQVDVP
jgi:Fibronectin type 3 domain-containing protein